MVNDIESRVKMTDDISDNINKIIMILRRDKRINNIRADTTKGSAGLLNIFFKVNGDTYRIECFPEVCYLYTCRPHDRPVRMFTAIELKEEYLVFSHKDYEVTSLSLTEGA